MAAIEKERLTLPIEILEQISYHCDKATLRDLCVVSSAVYQIARPLRFRRLWTEKWYKFQQEILWLKHGNDVVDTALQRATRQGCYRAIEEITYIRVDEGGDKNDWQEDEYISRIDEKNICYLIEHAPRLK